MRAGMAGGLVSGDRTRLHDRFGLVLLLLLTSFLLQGLSNVTLGTILAGFTNLAAVVVTFVAAGGLPNRLWRAVVAVLVAAVFVTAPLASSSEPASAVSSAATFVLYMLMLTVVLQRVLSHRTVTGQTLLGAVCAYALVGLAFAAVFVFLDSIGGPPVFGQPVARSVYSYFSFVTMTTVGYGDYTARTALAQRFAVVEAVLGQMYLATAVARLVALYSRPDRGQNQAPDQNPTPDREEPEAGG